jgi:UPF0755 protein
MPSHRMRRHRVKEEGHGCLAPLIALVILVVLVAVGYVWGIGFIKNRFEGPKDYSGRGSGHVRIEIVKGQTSSEIARGLVKSDVVASVEAFVGAANENEQSRGIQPGFYDMRKKMSSKAALAILINPKNRVASSVTIPEGRRASEIVKLIAANTDFSKKQLDAVLADPGRIGVPREAKGKVEGYLFPSTYEITPDMDAKALLTQMVKLYKKETDKLGIQSKAGRLGHTPYQVLIVASIVQAEAPNNATMPKIARVIYNRLDRYGMTLGMDSTLHYYYGSRGDVQLTPAQLHENEPYNTRILKGLPPTPIDSPGEAALKAAIDPTPGSWRYFVTVNLQTKETKFATTDAGFTRIYNELRAYCSTSDAC